MDFEYRNPDVERQLDEARSIEALEAALVRLSNLVPSFMAPEVRGRQMFCPGLDALVPKLTERLQLPDIPLAKSNDNVVILATRFYPTGGHSKVAADISHLIGAERTTIVFTDIYRQRAYSQLLGFRNDRTYAARALVLLSAQTQAEKIVELHHLLAAIRPSRIFLMGNHMDMVAVAGAWPFRSVVDYVHHADHMPALGATLPFCGHADLTWACHQVCREAGLRPVYAGMSVRMDSFEGRAPPAASGRPFRFATCGALHKYRQPAAHRWSDYVTAAMRGRDAEFLHIGPYDDDFAGEMRAALVAAGLPPERYRFTGPLPDLRAALVAEGVDAYLASYPDSGGRANLEAMAAGLAPIAPVAAEYPRLLQFDLPMDSWIRIYEPEETPAAVDRSLELRPGLSSPEGRAALEREFDRFDRWVAEVS